MPARMAVRVPRGACPSHSRLKGVRVGDASNPGPTMVLPPRQPDPDYVHLQFHRVRGRLDRFRYPRAHRGLRGPCSPSRLGLPSGGRLATLFIVGNRHIFSGFQEGQAYVCAGARPILPQRIEGREFHVGHQGSTTAVVRIRMAQSGLVWRTGEPKDAQAPWTHADLACGVRNRVSRWRPSPPARPPSGPVTLTGRPLRRTTRLMPTPPPPPQGATPSSFDPSGHSTRGLTSSRLVSLAKPLVEWGSAKAIGTQEARSFSTPSRCVGSCGPLSWSWSVCGPSSRTPNGWSRFVNISGAWATDSIRKEQASDYLAQVRTRGILTATRHDYWHLATGPLQALFSGTPPPRRAIVGSARVLGPHPPTTARSISRMPRRAVIP